MPMDDTLPATTCGIHKAVESRLDSLTIQSASEETVKAESNGYSKEVEISEPSSDTGSVDSFSGRGAFAIAGCWMAVFATFGYTNSFGIYESYYSMHILNNVSPSTLSWIGSLQLFLLLFVGLYGGMLFDSGYLRHLIISGSLIYVLSNMMVSLCTRYWQFLLAQGIGFGVGAGLIFTPTLGVVGHWYKNRRSLAMGIVTSGASLGGVCFPIMVRELLNRGVSFPTVYRAAAFVTLGLLGAANLLMRTRVPPRPLRAISDLSAFREGPYFFFVLGNFVAFFGLYVPYFFIAKYTVFVGAAGQNMAFYMIALLNGASAFGRIAGGAMGDKIGRLNALILSSIGCTIMLFAWLGCKSLASVIVFSALYGFFNGGYVSLCFSTVGMLTPQVNRTGARLGMLFGIISLSSLTGSPIAGRLGPPLQDDYTPAILFAGLTYLVGTFFLVVSRLILVKTLNHVI